MYSADIKKIYIYIHTFIVLTKEGKLAASKSEKKLTARNPE